MRPAELIADALNRAHLNLDVKTEGDIVKVTVETEPWPEVSLRAISAGEGWPSDVRAMLTEVGPGWPRDSVAVASRFSPGAVRFLLEAGANWADSVGDIRIVRPPLLIRVFAHASGNVTTIPTESGSFVRVRTWTRYGILTQRSSRLSSLRRTSVTPLATPHASPA